MNNPLFFCKDLFFGFVRNGFVTSTAGLMMVLLSVQAYADTYLEEPIEDAVIASGLPDRNLDARKHSVSLDNMLLHTWDGGNLFDDYDTHEAAAASQEYLIFKFDFSDLPAEATITSVGDFSWDEWYTHSTDSSGTPHPNVSQETLGLFEFFEITAGDADWEDNQFADGTTSPGAVTYNSLGGTFTKLEMVSEVDTGEGGAIVPGKLISDTEFQDNQQLSGIPIATLNRLRSGASVGLAMGSIPDIGLTNFSIHSSESGTGAAPDHPMLMFEFTTDIVLDPADFDEDGDVDGADLATWQAAFGTGAGGDTDSDSDSDGADFLAWQQSYTGSTGLSAVPEPATLGLVCFAGLLTLSFNRRRCA